MIIGLPYGKVPGSLLKPQGVRENLWNWYYTPTGQLRSFHHNVSDTAFCIPIQGQEQLLNLLPFSLPFNFLLTVTYQRITPGFAGRD
jgi:hypothetical protein